MIQKLKDTITEIQDFPKAGIMFRDICPVLMDNELSQYVTDSLCEKIENQKIDAIVGLDSRGFLFGMCMAQKLGIGFIPVRKKGKLPGEVHSMSYDLEYGTSVQEIQKNVITDGMRIHIHDDLIATGGSVKAASDLVKMSGGNIISYSFIMELSELNGRSVISEFSPFIETILKY